MHTRSWHRAAKRAGTSWTWNAKTEEIESAADQHPNNDKDEEEMGPSRGQAHRSSSGFIRATHSGRAA